jgi:hypothetical protein
MRAQLTRMQIGSQMDELRDAFVAVVGPEAVRDDAATLALFSEDSGPRPGIA